MTDTAVARTIAPAPGLKTWVSALVTARRDYRRKREIYLRTLRELQSYRPHELQDLRIQPADFDALARQQAGW